MMTINDYFYVWKWGLNTSFVNPHNYGAPSILFKNILNNSLIMGNIKLCPSLSNLTSNTSFNNHFWGGMDLYFHQHYGNKILNPIYEDMSFFIADETYRTVNVPVDGNNIGFSILTLYGNKWDVLIKSLGILEYIDDNFKYKPLENYDKSSSISVGEINHNGSVSKYERTTEDYGTESNTKDGEMKVNTSGTSANNGSTNTHSQKGFNSSSWNETDKDVSESKINQDVKTTFTDYEDTHTWGSAQTPNKTTTKSSANGDTVDVDETRNSTTTESTHGNIGVTTSQQMLESELVMRNNIIYQTICQDLAKYLALSVY